MAGAFKGVVQAVASVLGGEKPQSISEFISPDAPAAPKPAEAAKAAAVEKPKESAGSTPRMRGGRQATVLTTNIDEPKLGG